MLNSKSTKNFRNFQNFPVYKLNSSKAKGVQLINNVTGVYTSKDYNAVKSYLSTNSPPMDLLWEVGTQTGLRISDLLRLKLSDSHKGIIYARESKTKKYRVTTITLQTHQNLALFASKNGISDTDPLFPFTRQKVWREIRKAGEACGLPNLGTHSMRKTYAWLNLLDFGSVDKVQLALMHAYQSTTMQYLKPGLEDAAKKGRLVF